MPATPDELKALLGQALEVLSRAGASPTLLGEFSIEFTPRARAVLQVPDPASAVATEPELHQLIKQALQEALDERGIGPAQSTMPSSPKPRQQALAKRFTVFVRGLRTTVTIEPRVYESAVAAAKTRHHLLATVRQLAELAPQDHQRSRWISERLLATLEAAKPPEMPPDQARH